MACTPLVAFLSSWIANDGLPTEDRLWHLALALALVAADQCIFEREETYGCFLADSRLADRSVDPNSRHYVRVRYFYADMPAGKARVEIGDWVEAVNDEPAGQRDASAISEIIQRATRARIQPLTLKLFRISSLTEVNLWGVPFCRLVMKLVDNPVVSEFSDGAYVVITSGLLAFVRSQYESAWVQAHEIGHHALKPSEGVKLQDVLP